MNLEHAVGLLQLQLIVCSCSDVSFSMASARLQPPYLLKAAVITFHT